MDEVLRLKEVAQDVQPDCVFHLAGFTSATRDRSAVIPTFQTNLVSTVNLLSALTESGCKRIVLAGSLEEPQTVEEEVSSPYAASKWASTVYARMFWRLYRTPVAVARIFMVYGPAQRDVKKLIPYTILKFLRQRAPEVSRGTRLVDWVSVRDVVSGLIALGHASGVEGETVDLGTGILTSVREVVETIRRLMESNITPEFGVMVERQHEQVRKADVARTSTLLGWSPAVALETGLTETIDYYREHLEKYRS